MGAERENVNRSEFNTWLDGHAVAFSSLHKHLREMTDAEREMFRGAWFAILEKVEAQDAIDATQKMLADPRVRPRFLDEHPARVFSLSMQVKRGRDWEFEAAASAGGELVRCQHCNDFGWVEIYSELRKQSAAHPCVWCEKGVDVWARHTRGQPITDEVKKFVVDHMTDVPFRYPASGNRKIEIGQPGKMVKIKKVSTGLETIGWITMDRRFIYHWWPVPEKHQRLVRGKRFLPAAIPPRAMDDYKIEIQETDAPKDWLEGKATDVSDLLGVIVGKVVETVPARVEMDDEFSGEAAGDKVPF